MSEWTLEETQTCIFSFHVTVALYLALLLVSGFHYISLFFLKHSTTFNVGGFPVAAPNDRLPFKPLEKMNPGLAPRGPSPCYFGLVSVPFFSPDSWAQGACNDIHLQKVHCKYRVVSRK